jgi:hypothetical protein
MISRTPHQGILTPDTRIQTAAPTRRRTRAPTFSSNINAEIGVKGASLGASGSDFGSDSVSDEWKAREFRFSMGWLLRGTRAAF